MKPHKRHGFRFTPIALIALALTAMASAQIDPKQEETWSAVCGSKIETPAYPPDAVADRVTGAVSISFTVGPGGKATNIALQEPGVLSHSLQGAIEGANFPAACVGRRVGVTAKFQIADPLPAQYYISGCFFPSPNTFLVSANRIKLTCGPPIFVGALTAAGGIKPVTVCEVLANPLAFNGKDIALLGRPDNALDGSWLRQDNCGLMLITDGHEWPYEVALGRSSPGSPPGGILVLDPVALAEKIAFLRLTTDLGEEPAFSLVIREGKPITERKMVGKKWEVIFGRFETRETLRPRQPIAFLNAAGGLAAYDWGNGFGNAGEAPAQIIYSPQNRFLIADETVPVQ